MRAARRRLLSRLGFVLLAATFAAAAALAEQLQPIPALRARVTDTTGTLAPDAQAALEQKLAAFEARKGAQVAVLLVATTAPETIEQYGLRVAEAWRLGRAASDDGALLLVAKDDRALRIEVGYGLEGALTDARSNRIIDETIVPHFRSGDFAGGIDAGVDAMLRVIEGEELPPPEPEWSPDAVSGLEGLLPFALFGIPIGGSILRRIFGAVLGPLLAGGLMFALVWLVTHSIGFALAFGLFSAMFAALAGRPAGRVYRRGRHSGWGGGSGGGNFGGGGGFGGGGFSGGGGSFGGGGASGRW